MDRRTRKSKEALKNALLELLKKKTLHEIQIKQLCEKADVNRSTYYSNYSDLQEILRDIYQDAIDMITSQVITLTTGDSFTREEYYNVIYQIVCYLQENDSYYSLIFSLRTDISFEEMLYLHYLNSYHLEHLTTQEKYLFLYQTIGAFSIVRAWMQERYIISAHDISKMITDTTCADVNIIPGIFSLKHTDA